MEVQTLIEEMQEVKQAYHNLEISEILSLFNINALRNLTTELKRLKYAITTKK